MMAEVLRARQGDGEDAEDGDEPSGHEGGHRHLEELDRPNSFVLVLLQSKSHDGYSRETTPRRAGLRL